METKQTKRLVELCSSLRCSSVGYSFSIFSRRTISKSPIWIAQTLREEIVSKITGGVPSLIELHKQVPPLNSSPTGSIAQTDVKTPRESRKLPQSGC
ncbi:hypothetical protein SLA2020_137980 [Shorea laevis]